MTGKPLSSWLKGGITELLAELAAAQQSNSWASRWQAARTSPEFLAAVALLQSTGALADAGVTTPKDQALHHAIVMAPIPDDMSLRHWAASIEQQYGVPASVALSQRRAERGRYR